VADFHLVLLVHAHQPVGNFDSVFEQVYQRAYRPFVEQLERHPRVRLGLHFSGSLLEWLEQRHPDFFDRLRQLVASRQVEMVGGGYYEPILVSIPREDQIEQLRRQQDYLLRRFGESPSGAWLTERVWEPQLPSVLASAGVKYTLVDDLHFLAAGFEAEQLCGDYVVEDCGQGVRVLPSLKQLRYLLPFRAPEDAIHFLRERASLRPSSMAAMGDDLEKFGAWPGTYDHCYRDGWIDRFFTSLEAAGEWLATTPPGEYLAMRGPLGRADLPTASYPEMMEWALPTPARDQFHAASRDFASRADVMRFLRGGPWRAFFTKYAESNLLQKKMLRASAAVRALNARRLSPPRRAEVAKAREHVLRAQCNDAYWHGVFGGLYAPHLRTALWTELIRAETIVDKLSRPRDDNTPRTERCDYDADGAEEILISSRRMSALFRPADGGTLGAFDFRPAAVTLINSIQRRREAYHAHLRDSKHGDSGAVASIHDRAGAREEGLDRFLNYDRWARNAFRLLVFSPERTLEDYQTVRLEENGALAGGAYTIREAGPARLSLACEASAGPGWPGSLAGKLCCVKHFSFAEDDRGCRIGCSVELGASGPPLQTMIGLEIIINFLAPEEPDRYFDTMEGRHPLRWTAALAGTQNGATSLRLVDEWQNVAATIEAPGASQVWIAPIETVSESELGFERVYQGSQILMLWPAELGAATWNGEASLHVEPVKQLSNETPGRKQAHRSRTA
jgi:alpha-amylase